MWNKRWNEENWKTDRKKKRNRVPSSVTISKETSSFVVMNALTTLLIISVFDFQSSLKISTLAVFEKSETLIDIWVENWWDGSVWSDELAMYDDLYREMFLFLDVKVKNGKSIIKKLEKTCLQTTWGQRCNNSKQNSPITTKL